MYQLSNVGFVITMVLTMETVGHQNGIPLFHRVESLWISISGLIIYILRIWCIKPRRKSLRRFCNTIYLYSRVNHLLYQACMGVGV